MGSELFTGFGAAARAAPTPAAAAGCSGGLLPYTTAQLCSSSLPSGTVQWTGHAQGDSTANMCHSPTAYAPQSCLEPALSSSLAGLTQLDSRPDTAAAAAGAGDVAPGGWALEVMPSHNPCTTIARCSHASEASNCVITMHACQAAVIHMLLLHGRCSIAQHLVESDIVRHQCPDVYGRRSFVQQLKTLRALPARLPAIRRLDWRTRYHLRHTCRPPAPGPLVTCPWTGQTWNTSAGAAARQHHRRATNSWSMMCCAVHLERSEHYGGNLGVSWVCWSRAWVCRCGFEP